MEILDFISNLPAIRQGLMNAVHKIIISNDRTVKPVIKPMMGKEMILYEEGATMKYGLASTIKYMSLHCLPMYMNPAIYDKYLKLLPDVKFQKGCINFTDETQMPPGIIAALIKECSAISITALLENRKKKKK